LINEQTLVEDNRDSSISVDDPKGTGEIAVHIDEEIECGEES
jgi:hypothetical protein